MSRRIRRLSMLPTCAGLLLGLGALACSDKRDDDAAATNTNSEISTTTPADATLDTSVATSSQGGNVTASEPVVTTEATPRRTTRRSSSTVRADASAEVSANDPYAPDVSREPSRTTPAEIKAEARADVNRAEPVDATRNDPAMAPTAETKAEETVTSTSVSASATAPRAEVSATAPSAAVTTTPSRDSAAVTVTTPRAAISTTTPAPASTTPSASSSNPDAPLVPVGPAAKGFMNDPQLINVLLLANTGDSARAAEVLGASSDVAVKEKEDATTTASLGGTVAPRTRIIRVDSTDIWPPRNMHDDPRPRTRTVEIEVPVEEPRPAVSASAAVNPVTPGVSITTDAAVGTGAAEISVSAVRAFAESMVRDHTAVNARLAAMVTQDGIAPAESEKSIEVFNNNREAATTPRRVTDNASARTWLEREVRAHEQALDNIDRQLLPLAVDDELRTILEETKRTVQSHLTQARQLLGTAGSVNPTPAPKTGMETTPMPGLRTPATTDSMRIRTDSMPASRPMPADTTRPVPERSPAQPYHN